jgi:hypothetical protein
MPPDRFKDPADWTAADHLHVQRDPGYKPETDEYRAAVRRVLVDVGLELEPEPRPTRPR